MAKKYSPFMLATGHIPGPADMGSRLLFLKIAGLALKNLARRIGGFYLDGFRRMRLGRTLWVIIIIKLLVMFGVLKLFFFPDYLEVNFSSDTERAEHVFNNLTQTPTQNNVLRRSR